jgi:hypothetical protein
VRAAQDSALTRRVRVSCRAVCRACVACDQADAILEHYATHAPHRVSTVILESCLQSYTHQSALTFLNKAMTPPRSTQPAAPLQGLARFIMQPPADEVPPFLFTFNLYFYISRFIFIFYYFFNFK